MQKLYAFGEKRKIDLSLSENPLGCSPRVSSALKTMKIDFNDYPVPNGKSLKTAFAKENDLDQGNFFISNGSEATICALPRVFMEKNAQALMPSLTFPMFNICSSIAGMKVKEIEMTKDFGINLEEMRKAVNKNTKLVFLCNPNNPTGSIISKKEIINFLDSLPKSIFLIVDEANIEFGGESVISEVKRRKNLIVLRTFSKGFGLASLRVGFAVSCKNVIKRLEEKSQPFATSGISEQLVIEALKDKQFIKETKEFVDEQREFLRTELEKLGFKVFPSEANNLFVKIPTRIKVKTFLNKMEQESVSLVMGKNFKGIGNRFFRLSIRDKKTNMRFLKIINNI